MTTFFGDVFNSRILKVTLEYEGFSYEYENVFIRASGEKTTSATENTCSVELYNITKEAINDIMTNLSPFVKKTNRFRQTIKVEAGRQLSGYSLVFLGDITEINQTQKPDIACIFRASTSQFPKGDYVNESLSEKTTVNTIANLISNQLGLSLNFIATDKDVLNYSFSGSPTIQLRQLEKLGFYDVYIDDDELVVKDTGKQINDKVKLINQNTGMIGIPKINEFGVTVKFLFDDTVKLGSKIKLESNIYKEIDGEYEISKLNFSLSNRQKEFYYEALCDRISE